MSDRLKGLTIVFKKPIRDDDAESMIKAMYLFENVAKVIPKIVTHDHIMAVETAKFNIRERLWKALHEDLP